MKMKYANYFFNGMFKIFDFSWIFGMKKYQNYKYSDFDSDADVLKSDWKAISKDMESATIEFKKKYC